MFYCSHILGTTKCVSANLPSIDWLFSSSNVFRENYKIWKIWAVSSEASEVLLLVTALSQEPSYSQLSRHQACANFDLRRKSSCYDEPVKESTCVITAATQCWRGRV